MASLAVRPTDMNTTQMEGLGPHPPDRASNMAMNRNKFPKIRRPQLRCRELWEATTTSCSNRLSRGRQIIRSATPKCCPSAWLAIILALIVGSFGTRYAFQQLELAKWNSYKDFRDDCGVQKAAYMNLSSQCELVLSNELPAPPYVETHFPLQHVKREVQESLFADILLATAPLQGHEISPYLIAGVSPLLALFAITFLSLRSRLQGHCRRLRRNFFGVLTDPASDLSATQSDVTAGTGRQTGSIAYSTSLEQEQQNNPLRGPVGVADNNLRRRRAPRLKSPRDAVLEQPVGQDLKSVRLCKGRPDSNWGLIQEPPKKSKAFYFAASDLDSDVAHIHALSAERKLCPCSGWYDVSSQSDPERRQAKAFDFLSLQNTSGDSRGAKQCSHLYYCAIQGREKDTMYGLSAGEDVNQETGYAGSAIQAAALHGREYLVSYLIDKGANVNMQGGLGISPLEAAASEGHFGVARILLSHEAQLGTAMQSPRFRRAYQTAYPNAFPLRLRR